MTEGPGGVLLVNLGTPDAPRPREVRRYLREFLGDPRVLDIPAAARWLVLEGVILPFRPRRSARAYSLIWSEQGSPLLVHGLALRDALREQMGAGHKVEIGMRYGQPSIAHALAALLEAGIRRLQVLPLFPQYSEAATGSALARVRELVAARSPELPISFRESYYDHPGFVSAWRSVAAPALEAFAPDHVLMSFHGLPEKQIRSVDERGHCQTSEDCCASGEMARRGCYRAQCFASAEALRTALALPAERTSVGFQSRLGPVAWIRPHTDRLLPELRGAGVRRLAVLCPAFSADCLETLEEIGLRAAASWQELGGEDFLLVNGLNAHPAWVKAVAGMLREDARPGPAEA